MNKYEIEIKSLLGDKDNADALKARMQELDQDMKVKGRSRQLNHYFVGGDMDKLYQTLLTHIAEGEHERLQKILTEGKNFSIRTREINGKVLFVVKASIGDDSSENGVMRMEFEGETKDLTLDQLDRVLLTAGLEYQAKWSREREEFEVKGATVCLDKNAGYGYLAEVEKVLDEGDDFDQARSELLDLMSELNLTELSQDRLERMFKHYNAHWSEYYGTDKTFTVE